MHGDAAAAAEIEPPILAFDIADHHRAVQIATVEIAEYPRIISPGALLGIADQPQGRGFRSPRNRAGRQQAEKQEAQKTTPSITEEQFVKAFNTGQNQEQLFAQFINGKSMDEIQQAVTMLDNSISEEGCFRLSAALEDCGLSNITAPYTEKLMDSIYQDMDER